MTVPARALKSLLIAAVLAAISGPAGGDAPRERQRGLVERVDVDLILVDIEARDARGRPMRGLGAADFEVRVSGVRRPLYSVDDQCACADDSPAPPSAAGGGDRDNGGGPSRAAGDANGPASGAAGQTTVDAGAPGDTGTESPILPSGAVASAPAGEPAQLIFYFDFALMDLNGRLDAIDAARRWVAWRMGPDDEVMIVGHTFARGAVTLVSLTSDRPALTAALDAMRESREFVDSHFSFMHSRVLECKRDWADPFLRMTLPNCNSHAHDEYNHTSRTLRALARYMETLDPRKRKHLVLFHQMAPFIPSGPYPGARLRDTQEPAVAEVGAAAVAARVSIHSAATDAPTTVGDLAAEYTGGIRMRRFDLDAMLEEVRHRCACLYRLGIEPLEREKGRTLTLTVRIRSRSAANMRVKVLTAADRWMHQARRVLAHPAAARDLPVHAALVPVAARDGRWTAKVQVALHASALTRLPAIRGSHAEWEAGARLEQEGKGKGWDLLAISTMKIPPEATPPEWFVHEKVLGGLPAGTYRLAAFVRDRSADLFGGASSLLVLPDPGRAAIVGPIPLLAGRRILTTDLPLQPASRAKETSGMLVPSGLVPAGEAAKDGAGSAPMEIVTWLCGAGSPAPAPTIERHIGFGDTVLMSFPSEIEWAKAGSCLRMSDKVEAGLIDDAAYRYHVRWRRPADEVALEADVELP